MAQEIQVICARNCGFRVHDRYFEQKTQFQPGVCPRCSGPLNIVEAYTDNVIAGATMVLDRKSSDAGKVVLK